MEADFAQWVDAGLLVDVSPYMEKYTVMRDYYNSIDPGVLFYAASDDGAVYRIPGDVAEPACETLWIRQDWLDNLGLEVPTTLDELRTDIGDIVKEYSWSVISGNRSLDEWDTYIADLEAAGLEQVIDELTQLHGAQMQEYAEFVSK